MDIITFMSVVSISEERQDGFDKVFSCICFETYEIDMKEGIIKRKVSDCNLKFMTHNHHSLDNVMKEPEYSHNISTEDNCINNEEMLKKAFCYWRDICSIRESLNNVIVTNIPFPVVTNFFHEMINYQRSLKAIGQYHGAKDPDMYYPYFYDISCLVHKNNKNFNGATIRYAYDNGIDISGKYYDVKFRCKIFKEIFMLDFFRKI